MGIFKDDMGREYTIRLLPRTISRVRMATRHHLDVNGDKVFEKEVNLFECMTNGDLVLLDDPYLRSIIVYYLCQADAEKHGLSEGEFLDSILSENTMKSIETALMEAISDFFPDQAEPVRRMTEAKTIIAGAVTSAIDRISAKASFATDALNGEVLDKIVELISETDPSKLSTMSAQELRDLVRPAN